MELTIKFIDKEGTEHTYTRRTMEPDWAIIDAGRIIIFEDTPSGVVGVETKYGKFGDIKKSMLLQALTDQQVAEIEDRHRKQLETMQQRQRAQQSGLIIPGVNSPPPGMPQAQQQRI